MSGAPSVLGYANLRGLVASALFMLGVRPVAVPASLPLLFAGRGAREITLRTTCRRRLLWFSLVRLFGFLVFLGILSLRER